MKDKEHYELMRDIISDLRTEIEDNTLHDECLMEIDYTNLGISKLHNKFFELYAKEKGTTKTQLLRDFLNALMSRNPKLVQKAKEVLINEHDETN